MTFYEALDIAAADPAKVYVRPSEWEATDCWFFFLPTTGHWAIHKAATATEKATVKPGWFQKKWMLDVWESCTLDELLAAPVALLGAPGPRAEIAMPPQAGPMGISIALKMGFHAGGPIPVEAVEAAASPYGYLKGPPPPAFTPPPKKVKKKKAAP